MDKTNLLELVPERIATECERSGGRARMEFPRFRSEAGRWFGRLLGKSEKIRLSLDEHSTAVWDLVDGWRTVKAIGQELQKRYGDEIEPLYPRLSELLKIMENNRLIRYRPHR